MWLKYRGVLQTRARTSNRLQLASVHTKTVSHTTGGLECVTYTPDTPSKSQPVLFVHGEWTGSWFWEEQVLPYAATKGLRSSAFSFVGHGGSETVKNYNGTTIMDYTNNLHSVIQHLYSETEEFPVLVGHGLGNIVILNYLRNTPSAEIRAISSRALEIKKDPALHSYKPPYANSVVLMQPYEPAVDHYPLPPTFKKVTEHSIWSILNPIVQVGGVKLLRNAELLKQFYFPEGVDEETVEQFLKKMVAEPKILLPIVYRNPIFRPMDTFHARDFMVIRGSEDKWSGSNEAIASAVLTGLPQSEIKEVVGGAHSMPLHPEHSKKCVDIITEHLARIDEIIAKLNAADTKEEEPSLLEKNLEILHQPGALKRGRKDVQTKKEQTQEEPVGGIEIGEIKKRMEDRQEQFSQVLEEQRRKLQEGKKTPIFTYKIERNEIQGLELVKYYPELQSGPTNAKLPKHPLFFVHGDWTGAWIWEEHFMPWFASQGYTCYALSLMGHGKSAGDAKTLQTASITDFVSNIKTVLASLPSPPIVVAHSLATMYLAKLLTEEGVKVPFSIMMSPPRPPVNDDNLIYFHRKITPPSLGTFMKSVFNKETLSRPIRTPEQAQQYFFSPDLPDSDLMRYFGNIGPSTYRGPVTWREQKIDSNFIKALHAQKFHVMAGDKDYLLELQDLPEILSFFGLANDNPNKQTWIRPNGTGATVFSDVAHCLMLDPFWEEVAERVLDVVQKFESKETMASSLSNSLKNIKK
eukprot:TRINITY_DN5889_c0_g1_i2.p1 TRINITY_DN5889_c0_g1~~TRINITY_DN5889_c0_g1_i2.p1  ORF type:complete len:748 (-),score=166.46 TRINITY_DN5889_c0_g1_i2:7-2250(-)